MGALFVPFLRCVAIFLMGALCGNLVYRFFDNLFSLFFPHKYRVSVHTNSTQPCRTETRACYEFCRLIDKGGNIMANTKKTSKKTSCCSGKKNNNVQSENSGTKTAKTASRTQSKKSNSVK